MDKIKRDCFKTVNNLGNTNAKSFNSGGKKEGHNLQGSQQECTCGHRSTRQCLHQPHLPSFLATAASFFSSTRPNPMSSSSRSSRTWAASCDRQQERRLKPTYEGPILPPPLTSPLVYSNHHCDVSFFGASKASECWLALSKLEETEANN